MHAAPSLGLALACLVSSPAAQVGTGGFQSGDLYLYTVAYTGISSIDGAIVRIDPLSGATSVLHDLMSSSASMQPMAYDPWRDRLLFFGGFVGNHYELYAGDALGNVQSLGMATAAGGTRGLIAPRGDGIVYLQDPGNTNVISYLDAADQIQVVKNAAGTGDWHFALTELQFQNLLYVPKTNSLLAARWSFSDPCAGIPTDVTALHRLDLSPDGSRIVAESCFWYDSNPASWDGETRGLSLGPNGDPILVIGNGGTGTGPQQRIATVDVAGSSATGFATVEFTGQQRIVGGAYSGALGKAVVHDSYGDVLRAYAQGEAGAGTIVATGLSASGGSGEAAFLVEISSASYLTGLSSTSSTVSVSAGGTQLLTIDVGPAFAGSVYLALGSASGWTPGFTANGLLVPLNVDAYFGIVLANPNQLPLLDSFSLLDAQGRSTVTFQIPAGSNPSLAGKVLHHAAVVFGPTLSVDRTTNAVPVELVP